MEVQYCFVMIPNISNPVVGNANMPGNQVAMLCDFYVLRVISGNVSSTSVLGCRNKMRDFIEGLGGAFRRCRGIPLFA